METEVLDRMEVRQGDITKMEVDAVVNAANSSLLGGGGVDGAIHRAAGPELVKECRKIGGCPTGEARITDGYLLPARYVIHTVGPVYSAKPEVPGLLASCYRSSLKLAVDHGAATIAFPAISCGVYGYPIKDACRIAVDTTAEFLAEHSVIRQVVFALFSDSDAAVYRGYLKTTGG